MSQPTPDQPNPNQPPPNQPPPNQPPPNQPPGQPAGSYYQQPEQPPGQPAGTYYQQPVAEDPGKTLGIVGLVGAFILPLVGMIISIVGLRRSKQAGFKNTPALIGIILGALFTVVYIIVFIAVFALAGAAASNFAEVCRQLGPGEHVVGGVTYTCPG